MRRRLAGRLIGACLGMSACGAAPAPRPNVLLVTLDTTRADALGVYGNTRRPTPRIDAFAADAIVFDRANTVTPLTIPAHSSLFTGLYPPRHGVRDNGDAFLSPEAATLAERLHDAGYATLASVGAEVTSHRWGFGQGFDAYHDEIAGRDDATNRWRVERRGDLVLADALPWLAARKPGAPWFAWVHLFDAHHPYEAPEAQRLAFPDVPYLAEVAWLDTLVGRLLDDLASRGELDHTWVILVGDHGEGLGAHGEAMHGALLYDATVKIPMIVRPPGGLPGGRRVAFPTSLVDVTPTIAGAAGVPIAGVDGIDLGPWLGATAAAPPDRSVYVESLYAFHHYGWAPQSALVAPDWKLIDSTHDELYASGDALELDNRLVAEPTVATALQGQIVMLVGQLTPTGASGAASLDAAQVAQLEALGYLAPSAPRATGPDLPDPVDRLPVLADIEGARAALQRGDLQTARARAEAVLAREPGLGEVRILLAGVALRAGDLPAARAAAEDAHARAPSSNTWAMLATIRLKEGDVDGAVDAGAEAVKLEPYLGHLWTAYLSALSVSGDFDRFDTETTRAVGLLRSDAGVRAMYGLARLSAGDRAEAKLSFERALAENPLTPWANHGRGLIARGDGDATRAEQSFLDEMRAAPPGLASRAVLVEMYAEQRRYEDQLAQVDIIAKIDGWKPLTAHADAQARFNLGRIGEAAASVARCRAAFPTYSGCALLEANVLAERGDSAAAEKAFAEAKALKRAEDAAPR